MKTLVPDPPLAQRRRPHRQIERMNTDQLMIFFYGLFMDKSLLTSKGVHPMESTIGCENYLKPIESGEGGPLQVYLLVK